MHVFTVERLSGNFLISFSICPNFSSTAIGIGCLPRNRLENYAFIASQISVSWIPIYCVILMCVYEGGSFHWHFPVHDMYNFLCPLTGHSLKLYVCLWERGIRDAVVIVTWHWKVNIWYLMIVCFTIPEAFTLKSPLSIKYRFRQGAFTPWSCTECGSWGHEITWHQ